MTFLPFFEQHDAYFFFFFCTQCFNIILIKKNCIAIVIFFSSFFKTKLPEEQICQHHTQESSISSPKASWNPESGLSRGGKQGLHSQVSTPVVLPHSQCALTRPCCRNSETRNEGSLQLQLVTSQWFPLVGVSCRVLCTMSSSFCTAAGFLKKSDTKKT